MTTLLQLPAMLGHHAAALLSAALRFVFYLIIGLRVGHFVVHAFRKDAPYPSTLDFVRNMEAGYLTLCDLFSSARTAAEGQQSKPSPNPNELTQKHIDPIASRRWKEVLAWIVFHPEELVLVDKRKQTALHHACLFRAPAEVICMMLYQAPGLASMANVDDELPLHWAVRLSTPNEITRWLLTVAPGSACEAKDKDGNTALSLVWERHQETILEEWWSSGGRELDNHNGWKRILYYLQCHSYATSMSSPLLKRSTSRSMDEDGEAMDMYSESSLFRVLHAATRCPCCPQPLYSLLLKMYSAQIREQDEQGRLPLAVACQDPISNRSLGAMTKVHLLLAEYDQAAGSADNEGRLPILTALESGLVWEEGIDRLMAFSLNNSLLLRDPVTLLPAFLLAAVGSKQRAKCFESKQASSSMQRVSSTVGEARSLSTIYSLLRTDPAQLAGCFKQVKHSNSSGSTSQKTL